MTVNPGDTGTFTGILTNTEAGPVDIGAYTFAGTFTGAPIRFTDGNQAATGVLNIAGTTEDGSVPFPGDFGDTFFFSSTGFGFSNVLTAPVGESVLFTVDYEVDPAASPGTFGFSFAAASSLFASDGTTDLNATLVSSNLVVDGGPTAIPEPGSMALAAMLAGGVGAYYRRRRAAA